MMASAGEDPKSEATDIERESPEQKQILSILNYSQRGRMEEQRCVLKPVNTTQHLDVQASLPGFNYQDPGSNNHHGSAPQISVIESTPDRDRKLNLAGNQLEVPSQRDRSNSIKSESAEEQQKFMNMISHGQRGRMDDQRCTLDLSRSAPCSPKHTDKKPAASTSNADPDTFFNLLANTQSRRLDDQRVSLSTLPGLNTDNSTSPGDSGYLCYMVSKVQGSRMDDQRCSLPLIRTPETPKKDNSASGIDPSANSDVEQPKNKENTSPKKVLSSADQDEFLTIMSKTQRGRMDEQRCVLNVTPQSTPKHQSSQSTVSQGIKNGGTTSTAADKDANYLCYMVSKVQGSRMDEQRCSAPHVFQNMGTSSAQQKDHSSDASGEPPQRSASFNVVKDNQPSQEQTAADQEQFLKIMSHAQRGRMEEQRCSLQPSRSTPASPTHNGSALKNETTGGEADAFFKAIASSQARRLDDQRVALPGLPGISGNSERNRNSPNKKAETPASPPHITVAECTPTTSRKNCSSPESDSTRTIPKSASFTPETEYEKLNSSAQVTVRVSMSFTPQMVPKYAHQPVPYPEVFLTLGAPGENLVIPLSPVPGRRLSFDLNLVPREDVNSRHCSPSHASPRKTHSRQSSPNKKKKDKKNSGNKH
ncbi:uncharacterized protein LOC111580740 isoform X2 [Amphiprion ocellaris]|uniref:uncharacterized protein LOC111580740 isoform X2 n=1 Tax=Amphiprion ocellaris TaxID=80972 RepID=UPI002410D6E3|nr:uncharacterized protein LOC111580740 isoform X2 [Amphiprion ocellaris]